MFFTSNTHQVKTIPKTSEDEVVNDLNEVKKRAQIRNESTS